MEVNKTGHFFFKKKKKLKTHKTVTFNEQLNLFFMLLGVFTLHFKRL